MGNSDSSSRGATATASSSNGMRATDASAAGRYLYG